MSTGTGLVLLGIWLTCAACWHSRVVHAFTAIGMTFVAITATVYLA